MQVDGSTTYSPFFLYVRKEFRDYFETKRGLSRALAIFLAPLLLD